MEWIFILCFRLVIVFSWWWVGRMLSVFLKRVNLSFFINYRLICVWVLFWVLKCCCVGCVWLKRCCYWVSCCCVLKWLVLWMMLVCGYFFLWFNSWDVGFMVIVGFVLLLIWCWCSWCWFMFLIWCVGWWMMEIWFRVFWKLSLVKLFLWWIWFRFVSLFLSFNVWGCVLFLIILVKVVCCFFSWKSCWCRSWSCIVVFLKMCVSWLICYWLFVVLLLWLSRWGLSLLLRVWRCWSSCSFYRERSVL